MNTDEIARAFSGHRFEETFDFIAPDAVWHLVGQAQLEGREAIVANCRGTTEETAAETAWLRFVSTGAGSIVAVDAIGRYRGPEGVSVVSSCDIYEFANGAITAITSYAVDLPHEPK